MGAAHYSQPVIGYRKGNVMPATIRQLTPDGVQPVIYTADSLNDAAQYEPDGVYTITNTYDTFKVLKLDAHFDRLEDSARRESIPLKLDRARVRAALRQMIAESGYGSSRFRITVPHGAPDRLILSVEPFSPPAPEVYTKGVRCVTVPQAKRSNPAAKTTNWMESRRALQSSFPPGIYEGLLLNEQGEILEGLSSNFYAVLDGKLRTAGEGVLGGIARQVVLHVAPAILPVDHKPVSVIDIPSFDEAFISSASRGIVPVVEIDGVQIGDGAPGSFTLALRDAYLAWVNAHLEEL
jgi:branched-chain amino acid aminotransferase